MRLSGKIKYILGTPLRRWRDETDAVYVLDMPISLHPVSSELQVVKKNVFDDQLKQFVIARKNEDETWHAGDYQSEIYSRLEQGHWCYLAMLDGKPVGVIHVAQGACFIGAVRYDLKMPEDAVGLYDVYTSPIIRGQGFYTALFNIAVNDCAALGFHQAWMWIMPHNLVSLRVHNKLGLRHIFRKITQRQRWGFRWRRFDAMDISVDELLVELQKVKRNL